MEKGKPDLETIETQFELGDRFYEPEYMDREVQVRFREGEAQIKMEEGIVKEVLRESASQYYDCFM